MPEPVVNLFVARATPNLSEWICLDLLIENFLKEILF